jgi:PAS domain S-box-containing protein
MEALQVLVLDHNLPEVQVIQQNLQHAGFACIYEHVETWADFQACLNVHEVDLVLSEYDLLDGNGMMALKQVRSQCAKLPFIVVTNNTNVAVEAQMIEAGATDFILKQRIARLAPSLKRALKLLARDKSNQTTSDCLETEQALRQQIEFNRLIAKISTRFINIPASEIDAAINQALQEIGAFTQVDTSYVFEHAPDYSSYSMLFEWVAPGIEPRIGHAQNLLYEAAAWSQDQLRDGKVLHIPDIEQLPVEAAIDRQLFKQFGLQSLVVVPLSSPRHMNIIGCVGFASFHHKLTWSEANINLLRIVSEIFTNALHRQKTEALLQEAYQRLDFHVNNSPLAIIEWDADLRVTRWSKQAEAIFGWRSEETIGKLWYEWRFVHEDDFPALADHVQPLLNGSIERMISYNRNYTKSGTIAYCSWYNSILHDGTGKVKSILSLVADCTQSKQVELELKQARDQLEERVRERTAELVRANERLQREIIQKQAIESALRTSESRYRAIVEDQTEMVCRSLPDTTLTFVNEAYCSYFRVSKQDLIGKKFLQLIPLPQSEYVASRLAGMTAQSPLVNIEHESIDADGNPVWHQWINRGIYNEQGELLEIQSVGRDITARFQTEEALRQSEAKFRQLTENIRDIIWMRDIATQKLLYLSPSYEHITGYSLAETYSDMSFYINNVIHPLDRDRLGQSFASLMKSELREPDTVEYRIMRADGEVRWMLDRCFPVFNPAGQVYRYVGIAEDITDRRQTEASLKQSQATNNALISAIPDLMIRMRSDGTYLEICHSDSVKIYNPKDTFVGTSIYKVIPLDLARQRMYLVHQALQTGEMQFHEYSLTIDGEIHHEEARIIACGTNEVLVIIRDINDRKQAEAKIMTALEQERELGELKSRFVSITSHEFRNPLAIISAAAQALERYGDRLSEEKKLIRLKRIQASCNYMATLLNDILIFGKAEAGMLEFHPEPLNLAEWCEVLLEDFRLSQEIDNGYSDRVRLDYQITEASAVCMDERLLRHILTNLLSNAVKYSPDGKPIDFVVSRDPEHIIFEISDYGLGIPPTDLNRLFEPFHRAHNVRNLPGTGLGMSIVKKSVDMHGGKILVNTELGKGSTFTVILPSNPDRN